MNENDYDDRQRGPSRCISSWHKDDKFTWRLEVREQLAAVNLRLGEIELKGAFDGTLTLRIVETHFYHVEGDEGDED